MMKIYSKNLSALGVIAGFVGYTIFVFLDSIIKNILFTIIQLYKLIFMLRFLV